MLYHGGNPYGRLRNPCRRKKKYDTNPESIIKMSGIAASQDSPFGRARYTRFPREEFNQVELYYRQLRRVENGRRFKIRGGIKCRAPGSPSRKVEALVALLASQQEQDVKQTQERDRNFEHKEAGLIELIDHELV